MHFLTSYWDLGPVQVCAQGLDLPVAPEVAEGKTPSRALVQGLVTVVASEEEGRGELGLVEHHYVWSLLGDESVQVLLLLERVDAAYIPHQDCQGHLGDVEVPSGWLLVPLVDPVCLWSLWVVPLSILESGSIDPCLVAWVSLGYLGVCSFTGYSG